jgi:hypothetical protein
MPSPTANRGDTTLLPETPRERSPSGVTKASFNLPDNELDELRRLAARRHTTATQVVRQSLQTELYIQRLVDQGQRILSRIGRRGPFQEHNFLHMRL